MTNSTLPHGKVNNAISKTSMRWGNGLIMMMLLFALTLGVKANPIDIGQAREVGAKFVNGSMSMRATANDLRHVTTYKTDRNVAAFYVFNMANGFIIVAADDCSIPILAYSKEGSFDMDNIPMQMEGYLQVYRKEIQYGIEHGLSGDESIAKQWNMLRTTGSPYGNRSTTAVEPLLSETWDQNCYYNALCPEDSEGPCGHVYVGCVATAMGQIMHFWQYPVVGSGSHTYYPDGYSQQTANFGATTYDWNNMPDNLNSSSSSTQINAVATLLWHCGIAVNMMYSASGSGAYSNDVPNALTEYFNYSDVLFGQYKEDNTSWLSLVKSNLDLGLPVYYSGSDVNDGGGHAFVCDGYDSNDQLHFNWGWSGSGNGYFAVDALNVGGYQFNNYNYAIFNIRPQTGNTYQITAEANPAEGGTVSGGGTYYEGRLCTLTAVSDYDYNFVNWTKDGVVVSTEPSYSFMVTEDATYVANFALFEGITIGSGTATNMYLPSYSYYCYTLSEQIYTSEDLDMPGAITSLAFYNAGETKTRVYDIYMVNTEKTYFENSYDWITPTAEDLVFSGTMTMTSGNWTTFILDNPFIYDGNNFALIVDDNTGSWTSSPHMACRVFGTENMQAMRVYSDGPDYDPFNPTQYEASATYYEKNQIRITMESLTASTPMVNPDPIDLGYRPNGAWMPPYTFNLYNPGYYTTINSISSTNPYFQLDTEGLDFPFNLGYHGYRDIKVDWGTGGGQINGLLNINYGDNESVQYNMTAHAYTPVSPDVWEMAEMVTDFPYTANLNSTMIPLYNNYHLPPNNIIDGADAVYKLVFTEDTYLNASITSGEDGKMALYPEGFYGEGGPDLNNNYTAPEIAIEEWLYYDDGNYTIPIGASGSQFWWGIKLDVEAYADTKLTKVSVYDCADMEGEIMIYQTEGTPSGEPVQRQSISLTGSSQFEEFNLNTPYNIDPTKPLWIVIHFISGATYPAAASNDTGDPNGRWVSLDNSDWKDLTYYNLNYTWMLRGFVTNLEGRTMAIEGGNRDNLTYDFDDSSMQGWTTFQGSNTTSPHSWITSAEHYYGLSGYGHNASQGFVLSESYITGENYAVTPDNYLVSPLTSIGNGSVLNFWASDANDSYGVEHFSVEISTTSNYNAAAFTSIFETTLLRGQGQRTGRVMRDVMNDGIWYEYNVDLSAYAGQQVYIAFHHFDCYDQWFLAIDDITIISGDVNYGSITNMTVTPGTYYLVASSTSNEWSLEINTDDVPCPNPAYSPSPANYAEVNPNRTIELSWQFGQRTTEYKLMFGTTESCEQTLVDWTRELGHHYTLPALLDDMTYYWKVVERNDGCSEGVESPVWSFTTRLNPPQNLYVEEDFIMDGSSAVLYWSAPARALLSYNVYQDGILIGNTTDTYYVVEDLTYNMNGYAFYVTGVFDAGESDPSNNAYVYVSGYGTVNGHVYEQDGDTGIENATVTFTGYDEYGYYNSYSFITDADGYYEGTLRAGSYNATASCGGYQDKYYGSVGIIFNTLTEGIDITMDELFNPVAEILAEYYPDANDPSSPYVKVMWSNHLSGWHTYLESEFDNAYRSGVGDPSWGYEYPLEVISQYAGCNLTKVALFSDNIWGAVGGNFTCSIYLGGSAPEEGTLASTITVDVPVNLDDWVEYNLIDPVHVSGTEPLWVIWHANSTLGYDGGYPAGCASHSSAYGDWWNNGQDGWGHMGGYTWTMKNYFSNLSGREVALTYTSGVPQGNGNRQNRIIAGDPNHSGVHEVAINPNPERIPFEDTENNRSLQYYRVYRTNAYNNGPYTTENTEILSEQLYDTLYIDASWIDAAPGVYKWGVGCVYSGNRGEEIEGPISWAEMNTPNRNVTFTASVDPNANTSVGRARDGWLAYDDGTYATSIGNQTANDWTWGVMYPASMLGNNNTLTKVAIYNTDSYNVDDITIAIYQGGTTEPGTMIASQTVTPIAGLQEVTLTSPVAIDPSQNLWIVLFEYGTYVITSCNSTEPNNQWVEYDGWYNIGDLASSLASYGWMIRAYVENNDGLQEPRESEIAWSNFLDKDMYLNNGAVNVTVVLNSGDNPAGTIVSFTNLNSAEQLLYPIADITLGSSGYYAWNSFRKGDYEVTVAKDGYVTYIGYESIWDATALNYMLEEIMQSPTNLYVSSTGWAKWSGMGNDLNQLGSGDPFSDDFESGNLSNWTIVDSDNDGENWGVGAPSEYGIGNAHSGTYCATSWSWNSYTYEPGPDNWMISPEVAGATSVSYYVATNTGYPDHYAIMASSTGTNTSDFTLVFEEDVPVAKGGAANAVKASIAGGGNREMSPWTGRTIQLPAGTKYVAFRHYNSYDMNYLFVDDVMINVGAKSGDRHYEYNQVVLTNTQGGILYTENTTNKYCQLPVDNLVEGNTYHCKVASVYSSGMTEWAETDWVYQSCNNYEGASDISATTTDEGNLVSWTYPEISDDAKAHQNHLTESHVIGTLVTEKMPPIDNPGLNFRTTPSASNGTKGLAEALSNRATDAYCVCIWGNESDANNAWNRGLITFSLSDPASFNIINATDSVFASNSTFGLDYCTSNGYYYTYNNYTLYQIDINTGEIVNQTSINVDLRDGAWDVTTNTMYSISSSMLYSVDVNTGEVYSIGSMGLNMIALACDANGQLYAIELNDGGNAGLYQINKTTGASTLVGYTGVDSRYAQSATFDRETGILYWAQSNQSSDNFYSVNTTTGEATLLLAGSGEAAGLSIPTSSGSILGAMVYRDNELAGFTRDNSYLDENETNDHNYSIRVVYGGSAICPDNNMYYSMSCPQSTSNDEENHWNVDIHQYPYNMSVTGIIKINGMEQQTPALEIGAFSGDECRGSQRLTYFPLVDRYLVFFTLYGDAGDEMSFRLYDHSVGEELDLSCSSTISFVPDGIMGTAFDPYVFDFGNTIVEQVTNFSQGYNWWCTYIEQNGINGLQMLQESLGSNGVAIRSQVGYTDYYAGYGWYGSLSSMNNESSYKVITSAPCTVTMTGNAAVPSQHPITVSHGWTWMGYVSSTAMDVNEALSGLEATVGDKVKSQQGYADYYANYGWYGSLNTIEPGMGLMYYSANSEMVTFTYPDNGRGGELKANLTSENNHWVPNVYAYPDNMTVMAVVDLNDVELNSEHYELAAFAANGECRGSVRLTYAEPLHRHVAFLTVSGSEAAELSFRLYNTETNEEYYDAEESLGFVANAIVGDADDLYVVHFRSTAGMDELANRVQVYPNPVNAGERFSIGMANVESYPVHVEIVNALGVETLRATAVQTPVSMVAPVTAGVYTLRITVEGKGMIVRKLVVK